MYKPAVFRNEDAPMADTVNVIFAVLLFVCCFLIVKKIIGNRYATVKKVKAEVFDKYKSNTVSRIQGTFKREHYIVVFKTNDNKLSFNVSEFSYDSYKIKDKGILEYKGNRIISFKRKTRGSEIH